MVRLRHDCDAFGAPVIQFTTRFGHEPIPSFDEMYPGFLTNLRQRPPVDHWVVYLRIGDTRDVYSVGFTGREAEEIVAYELADQLQHAVIDLWQTASEAVSRQYTTWPRCPRHSTHPLWPVLLNGSAVWRCKTDESFAIPIGTALAA